MDLSIVVPVYNEHDNLRLLYQAICESISPLLLDWEVILVDDGSSDGSVEVMEELAAIDPVHVRVVELRRNFGQTAAIAAGIDQSEGDVVVLMDADMQNDPADIPEMLKKIQEGYDVVSGWRKHRQDNLSRRLPSQIANRMISWATGVPLHDYGCTLKAYRREVITGFRLYGEMHRFIPAYANSYGARIIEMPVRHHPRRFGRAKYGLERTLKVVLDLFTVKFLNSYANKPIYLFGGAGAVLIMISSIVLLYLFIRRIFFDVGVLASPLFQMSTMIFIMGFQSILMGLIAELLVRTYHESQGKPTYTIRKIIKPETGDENKLPDYAQQFPRNLVR
ncbi:MAG: glycosyltransferase family 2 protein [Chloroflexi bacterium]|nr:glycosyltransferase family 2 protein [Chloroflexota bacterium]